MIDWCAANLAPVAPGFEFIHHDVYNPGLNPNPLQPWVAPLPVEDGICSLIEATSVFTHLVEGQAEFYLDEIERVLAPDGHLMSTWFLFDKSGFPYMQDNQNALYINDRDPTNAVAYDRIWLETALEQRGLAIVRAFPPSVRGFHWYLDIARIGPNATRVEIPEEPATVGRRPPPLLRAGAHSFGLDEADFTPEVVATLRQAPPPRNPIAVELYEAKRYIASLTDHVAALEHELEAAKNHIASLHDEIKLKSG
jgi:SAM-dependent methyltransferase